MAGILDTKQNGEDPPKKVIIKYIVEADGVPIYTEHLDVDDLESEMTTQSDAVIAGWGRRIKCAICCKKKSGFGACFIRCLVDGKCCDSGERNCKDV